MKDKEQKIFRAIGQIDDDLIEQAANAGTKKTGSPWMRWTALAACFALIVAVVYLIPKQTAVTSGTTPTSKAIASGVTDVSQQDHYIEELGLDVSTLSVKATEYSGENITTDSGFIISGGGLTEELVNKCVNITPEADYTVQPLVNDSFLLTPTATVLDNSIINLVFTDTEGNTVKKWAFQTTGVFNVTSTYPAQGDVVSVYSGIEFAFSSESVDISSVQQAFTIDPAVDGQFELRGKSAVFVPNEQMEYGTEYDVTLSAAAADVYGAQTGKEISFTFKTEELRKDGAFYSKTQSMECFTPGFTPIVPSPANEEYGNYTIGVEVLAYQSMDDFADDLYNCKKDQGLTPDVDGLDLVSQFTAEQIISPNGGFDSRYIQYPDALGEGFYAVRYTITTETGETDCYGFIQVSHLSVYAAASDSQMLFWINDTSTDQVLAGAEIQLTDGENTITVDSDELGSAVIDLPDSEESTSYLIKIQQNGRYFVTTVNSAYNYNIGSSDEFFGTLYTSREMYQPTDTIRAWGYIRPRADEALPETVTVTLGGESEYNDYYQDQSLEVPIKANGSFTCEFDIVDSASEWPPISVYAYNTLVCQKTVKVNEYEKPIYVIDGETDKEIYFADEIEDIEITAVATFFDGTPASNMELRYTADYNDDSHTVFCDDGGSAVFNVGFNRADNEYWSPNNGYISINSNELDSVDTYIALEPILFYHDVMLQSDVNNGALDIMANYIDLTGVYTVDDLYTDDYPENIKGASYCATATVKVTENYWEVIPTGSYYDYVYKKTVETSTSQWVENFIGEFQIELLDGQGRLDGLELPDDRSYTFEISITDSDGYTVTEETYYSGAFVNRFGENQESTYLEFSAVTANSNYGNVYFGVDEDLEIVIKNNGEPFETAENSHFFVFLQQDSLYGQSLYSGDGFTFKFDEANIPNVNIVGAYYTDSKVYPIYKQAVIFDSADWELQVNITPESERVNPGDETSATITVTDKSGNPVANAALCVSVSDEAAFAASEQNAQPLEDIYNYHLYCYMNYFVSYTLEQGGEMMAEMGGEGGGNMRKDFADDVTFVNVETDENGRAVIPIKLAENLTSWRITALAAWGKMLGSGTANIQSGLPVFVSPVFTDTFLSGDDISFGCRTYGDEVTADDLVEYEAAVMDGFGNEVDIINRTGLASENAVFNFGKLAEGKYTFRLGVTAGEYTDGVELGFEVVQTAAELWLTGKVSQDEANSLHPAKYPVMFTIANGAYEAYNEVLNSASFTGTVRTDQLAASRLTKQLMADFTGDDSYLEDVPSITAIKTKYGYLSELEAGSGSAYFSARMAVAVPEYLNKSNLVTEFEATLGSEDASPEEITSAFMGLAAFGEPVLTRLREFAAQNESLMDETDMLRLGVAFALLGDYDSAQSIYDRYAYSKLAILILSGGETYLRVDDGENEEANVEKTALASTIASIMNGFDADALAKYLCYAKTNLSASNKTEFYPLCEIITYLTHCQPRGEGEVVFSYVKDGETIVETVGKQDMASIRFNSAEEYSNADITVVSGQASIVAAYLGTLDEVENQKSDFLSVEKSMDNTVSLGETITVTLTVTTEKPGWICVEDYIPSGFRLADSVSYVEGSVVRFFDDITGSTTFTYKIKPITAGDFVVEMPTASRIDNGLLVTGRRSKVEVTQ